LTINQKKYYKILIAGSEGRIGTFLNEGLKEKVTVHSCDFDNARSTNSNTKFKKLDLTKLKKVHSYAEELPQYDILIFLVGLAHAKGKGKDLSEFTEINYQTLLNLLAALEESNKLPKKIIFSSTISVYGEQLGQKVYCENSLTNPFSPYAVTKLRAENYLLEKYADKSWILRFAPVYSPKFTLNLDRRTRIKNLFFKIGNGKNKLSLCNIENILTAIGGIIDGSVPTGVYNISDPTHYTYNDLLRHQRARFAIRIPSIAILVLYGIGKITKNIFLKENSTKLVTDNLFPSNKISAYVDLNATINDTIISHAP